MGLFSKKTDAEKQELAAKRNVEIQKRNELQTYIKNFPTSATVHLGDYLMWNNENNDVLINRGIFSLGKTEIFKRSDIRSFEVIKDGEKSEKFGLGGATVGGLILGPIGLLGGFLLKKKKNDINDLRVRVYTSGDQAIHDIVLIKSKTKANSIVAKTANLSLQQIVEFLQKAIIELEEENTEQIAQSSTTSTADELLKLKSLLDTGILTQEEFDTQKSKLLG
ncbi:SHOCT domain-containing protein [Weissella soli]|uniref:SHOCT domain-containing protein n=1 Tax=Weissella soli TaxID=155866 RepID=UPI0011BB7B2D|nr:SHOCT domain-containing protein [Weissella soli]QEA34496.1 hypothetical protein FGL88_01465 [Weissella soli]